MQHTTGQPTESSGEKSLSVFHLAVLRVLEGQSQEAAPDKDMAVYNSKKNKNKNQTNTEVSWGQRDNVTALSCQHFHVALLLSLRSDASIAQCLDDSL